MYLLKNKQHPKVIMSPLSGVSGLINICCYNNFIPPGLRIILLMVHFMQNRWSNNNTLNHRLELKPRSGGIIIETGLMSEFKTP